MGPLQATNQGRIDAFVSKLKPTGTVTFYYGTTALKTESLSGGKAQFTTSMVAAGTHSVTATYNGSTSYDSSSASLTQTVN